ncbi:hypothetical protein S83_032322, partial [Arachis hypogaea]
PLPAAPPSPSKQCRAGPAAQQRRLALPSSANPSATFNPSQQHEPAKPTPPSSAEPAPPSPSECRTPDLKPPSKILDLGADVVAIRNSFGATNYPAAPKPSSQQRFWPTSPSQ